MLPLQTGVEQIGRLIQKGQAKLNEYQHPDPYIGDLATLIWLELQSFQQAEVSSLEQTPRVTVMRSALLPWRLSVCEEPALSSGDAAAIGLGPGVALTLVCSLYIWR